MPSIPFLAAPAVVVERAGMGSADSCRHSEKRKVVFSWSPVVSPFPDTTERFSNRQRLKMRRNRHKCPLGLNPHPFPSWIYLVRECSGHWEGLSSSGL